MLVKLNNQSIYRCSKFHNSPKYNRSTSSNSKQLTLPSLTPCKSSKSSQQDSLKWAKRSVKPNIFQNYEKIMREKEKYSSIVKNLKMRIQNAENLKVTYGIEIPKNIELTPKNLKRLEMSAIRKKQTETLMKAVNTIETWWKKRIILKKFQILNQKMHKCAALIQKAWRKHYNEKKFILTVSAMQKAAVKIQKVIRGFLVRKAFMLKIKEKRMLKVFEYFNKEKMRIMQESARKILAYWRIAKKRWQAKQEKLKKTKKVVKGRKKRAEEICANSYAAFPEPEPSKVNEGVERAKKNLSIKPAVAKKTSTPASPLFAPSRARSNTEGFLSLEVIKEVKTIKEE